jgi:hypothetical protein
MSLVAPLYAVCYTALYEIIFVVWGKLTSAPDQMSTENSAAVVSVSLRSLYHFRVS